jgi:hypothetical protein
MRKPRKPVTDKDALLNAACERAGDILMFYKKFAKKKPVPCRQSPPSNRARGDRRGTPCVAWLTPWVSASRSSRFGCQPRPVRLLNEAACRGR